MKFIILLLCELLLISQAFGQDIAGVGSTIISENGQIISSSSPERCVVRIDEEKNEISLLTSPAVNIPRKINTLSAEVSEESRIKVYEAEVTENYCGSGGFRPVRSLGGKMILTIDKTSGMPVYTVKANVQCAQADLIVQKTFIRKCDLNF